MPANVVDLDVLRPDAQYVKLAGKKIDVSFVPCGITFDVDEIVRELNALPKADLAKNGETTRKAFDLTIRLCSVFCEHSYSEMDEAWFRKNADPIQVKQFADAIKTALIRSYAGIEADEKNG
jgi:hypothetical protein